MTEATLLENNPDLSVPVVTPFTVAVPAVNYPPVLYRFLQLFRTVVRHAYSDLGYRYIAVVTFTDGRTEHVQAGHTAFIPALEVNTQPLFTWNTTFTDSSCRWGESLESKRRAEDTERCLPEAQRSTFAAEITLEEGNVVRKGMHFPISAMILNLIARSSGQSLKGRMTVRATTDGSTTMSDISVGVRTVPRYHWAQAHAAAGGDTEFYNATSGVCRQWSSTGKMLDANDVFVSVFDENDGWTAQNTPKWSPSSFAYVTVTPMRPYFDFDFELQVPHDTPVDLASYYNNDENFLYFYLTALYSPEVANCIYPGWPKPTDAEDELSTVDDTAKTEEELWDPYARVGKSTPGWQRTLTLQATVPIIVVGDARRRAQSRTTSRPASQHPSCVPVQKLKCPPRSLLRSRCSPWRRSSIRLRG
ncbi:hypothetical protein B0H13DRAFT_831225 [Mycena leptocephala]|nr:hypothetical protein B0H13DRAFT_831225 [Mycena leptocephala]